MCRGHKNSVDDINSSHVDVLDESSWDAGLLRLEQARLVYDVTGDDVFQSKPWLDCEDAGVLQVREIRWLVGLNRGKVTTVESGTRTARLDL